MHTGHMLFRLFNPWVTISMHSVVVESNYLLYCDKMCLYMYPNKLTYLLYLLETDQNANTQALLRLSP